MKIVRVLPPREVEGADQVLPGVECVCESGHRCRNRPAMTADHGTKVERIAFITAWRTVATPNDINELNAFIKEFTGRAPDAFMEGRADAGMQQRTEDWLRKGTPIKTEKTN